MEVRPGYKETKVGVIPEEWEVVQINDIACVKTGPFGSSLHESDYVRDGTPIITVEHLGEFGIAHSNLPMVSDFDRDRLKSYSLEENDIVFSRVGSVDRNALVSAQEDGWLFSGRLLRIRSETESVFSPYLSYHFHHEPFKQRVRSVAVGQTMSSLNTQIMKGIAVVLPPLPEQRAIAKVLSDVDALIASLDRLIAKKRAIKQGAMQRLLTGQTRLPGFSGEWEVAQILSLLTRPATYGIVKAGGFQTSGIPMVRGGDIKNGEIALDLPFVTKEKSDEYARTIIEQGDVLIALVGYPGESAKVPESLNGANISRAVGLLRPGRKILSDYLVCYLNSPVGRKNFLTPSAGSAQLVVNLKDLNLLQIPLPGLAEQESIAAILSDIDAEIAALEARRDKTRALKQGLMQELLTGRTRLV
jgi:type I restriction enzyme S subunit